MDSPSILAKLNKEQQAAATHTGGALLIVAGAGTGKTATLAHRVAYLISQGVDPGRILLLTFTRRAAAEMTRRVNDLLQPRPGDQDSGGPRVSYAGARVWGGTFHAIASRILRLHGREIGLAPEFTIMDRADSEDLMHVCRTELGLSEKRKRFPQKSTCLDIYSRCVNAREQLDHVVSTRFPWCRNDTEDLARLFDLYTERKENQCVLDYDDLLVFLHGLLASGAGDRVREHFDHVLVDEYQDTNMLQAEILSLLRPDGSGVTAVGDDAQSIYAFRAATVRNILDFEQRFPGAEVVTLEQNYRSTGPILKATNALIREATERRDKNLVTEREGGAEPSLACCKDEAEQTDFVIERILEHRERGVALKEQAVLFRAAHHSAALEIELSRRNIPFIKYGGLKFVEMAHIKDLLAFVRLAANPRDRISGMRILGLIPGIGPKTAQDLEDALDHNSGDFERAWVGYRAPQAAAGAWPGFVTLMRGLSSQEPGDLAAQIHAVRSFYAPLLSMRYDNVEARLRDLEQIESLASRYSDREQLLTELALDPPAYTQDYAGPPLLDEDYLILSTIHSAKGLEFDAVFVIHAADGNIPSDMATGSPEEIEEERRLLYVACTRARNDLYVVWPLRYYTQPFGRSDTHGYALRSRFVSDAVASLFANVHVGPDEPLATRTDSECAVTTTAAIRSSVRVMWTQDATTSP